MIINSRAWLLLWRYFIFHLGNPYLFSDNEIKARLINELNFESKEDALPFYKLPYRTLLHVQKVTKNDVLKGYCKNRLYYIAQKIQVSS